MSFDSNESGLIPDSRYLRKTFTVMMLIDFIYALKTYISNLVHRKMSHLYTEKSKVIVPMCWEHEKIFFLLFFFFKVFHGEKKKFPWLGEVFSKMVESEFYRNPVNNFQENFKSKNKYNQLPWLQQNYFKFYTFFAMIWPHSLFHSYNKINIYNLLTKKKSVITKTCYYFIIIRTVITQ